MLFSPFSVVFQEHWRCPLVGWLVAAGLGKDRVAADVKGGGMEQWESLLVWPAGRRPLHQELVVLDGKRGSALLLLL